MSGRGIGSGVGNVRNMNSFSFCGDGILYFFVKDAFVWDRQQLGGGQDLSCLKLGFFSSLVSQGHGWLWGTFDWIPIAFGALGVFTACASGDSSSLPSTAFGLQAGYS